MALLFYVSRLQNDIHLQISFFNGKLKKDKKKTPVCPAANERSIHPFLTDRSKKSPPLSYLAHFKESVGGVTQRNIVLTNSALNRIVSVKDQL